MQAETGMKKHDSPNSMKRGYARLCTRLAKLGPVLQGTITERTLSRDDPQHPGQQKAYGPYYQWTFKRHGKTVTVNLAPRQAKVYQRAIAQHRALEEIIEQMRTLSLEILEHTTQGVKKRKSRT
jgi:hypothetical protein